MRYLSKAATAKGFLFKSRFGFTALSGQNKNSCNALDV
jgi:hypothetical protein